MTRYHNSFWMTRLLIPGGPTLELIPILSSEESTRSPTVVVSESPTVLGSPVNNLEVITASIQPMTMVTRASVGTFKPNPRFAFTMGATEVPIPRSPKYAISIPQRKEALTKKNQGSPRQRNMESSTITIEK